MRLCLIIFSICLLHSMSVNASRIEHAMLNNWSNKKFRKAIRMENNVEIRNEHKETYIHIATRLNRPAHLETLLEERPEILEHLLWRNENAQTAMEVAIALNHIEPFRVLLRHLRYLNFRIWNRYQWTLMHLAARYNRVEFILELAGAGAMVNPVDATLAHWTPLDVALHYGHNEAAHTLRGLGGRVNALEIANDDILPLAAEIRDNGHTEREPDDMFNRIGFPLSDFDLGPAAIRMVCAGFLICLYFFQWPLGASH